MRQRRAGTRGHDSMGTGQLRRLVKLDVWVKHYEVHGDLPMVSGFDVLVAL